jgi:hypothetical protein
MSPDGTGRVRLTGWIGHEAAAIINAAIDPLTGPAGKDDDRTAGQRRADALTDVCRLALATGELPESGGDSATMVVTLRELTQALSKGVLDDGAWLSADTVRRVAYNAGIIPALLGSSNQVLNLGRRRRLFTGPLRRAPVLRDRGCAFPTCDRRPNGVKDTTFNPGPRVDRPTYTTASSHTATTTR